MDYETFKEAYRQCLQDKMSRVQIWKASKDAGLTNDQFNNFLQKIEKEKREKVYIAIFITFCVLFLGIGLSSALRTSTSAPPPIHPLSLPTQETLPQETDVEEESKTLIPEKEEIQKGYRQIHPEQKALNEKALERSSEWKRLNGSYVRDNRGKERKEEVFEASNIERLSHKAFLNHFSGLKIYPPKGWSLSYDMPLQWILILSEKSDAANIILTYTEKQEGSLSGIDRVLLEQSTSFREKYDKEGLTIIKEFSELTKEEQVEKIAEFSARYVKVEESIQEKEKDPAYQKQKRKDEILAIEEVKKNIKKINVNGVIMYDIDIRENDPFFFPVFEGRPEPRRYYIFEHDDYEYYFIISTLTKDYWEENEDLLVESIKTFQFYRTYHPKGHTDKGKTIPPQIYYENIKKKKNIVFSNVPQNPFSVLHLLYGFKKSGVKSNSILSVFANNILIGEIDLTKQVIEDYLYETYIPFPGGSSLSPEELDIEIILHSNDGKTPDLEISKLFPVNRMSSEFITAD